MPSSMTGFGRAELSSGDVSVTVEVRSVNNRYLNVKTRLPSRFLRFEALLEEAVRGVVARGTVDVNVRLKRATAAGVPVVDVALASQYIGAVRELARTARIAGDLDLPTLLGFPGVVTLEEPDEVSEAEIDAVTRTLSRALKELNSARRSEGKRLSDELLAILGRLEKRIAAVAARVPKVPRQHVKKLHDRIRILMEGTGPALDAGMLEREVALFADKTDVAEELARLTSHVAGFRASLKKRGAIGRSLDFLVQEMGREANTIGSKNQDVTIGRHVIELKTLIERLREQLQNLE